MVLMNLHNFQEELKTLEGKKKAPEQKMKKLDEECQEFRAKAAELSVSCHLIIVPLLFFLSHLFCLFFFLSQSLFIILDYSLNVSLFAHIQTLKSRRVR